MRTMLACLVAAVAAVAACTPRVAPPISAGRLVAAGRAVALTPSPDGSHLAWLGECPEAGRGGPGCALLVAPVAGGAPVRVAVGVRAAPGAFAWTSDGALVALSGRDLLDGAGDLVLWRPGAEPRVVAAAATSFASGGGTLAWSAGGETWTSEGGGGPARLAGGARAFELAVAPSGKAVAARVRGADGAPVLLLWRDGAGTPALVARDAGPFAFSPDGAWIAAVAGVAPGTEGMLVAVPVAGTVPAAGAGTGAGAGAAEPVVVARSVGPFQWAPGSGRLAWLEGFDARGNAGRLAAGRPGEPPVVLGERVGAFELAPGGGQVAFVRHVTQGGYAANLELSPSAASEPGTVARDAAAFAFSADGRFLLYRAGCSASGDGCTLFRMPATGLGPSESPVRIADGVAGFATSPGKGDRVLVAQARRDGVGVDLSWWGGGRLAPLDARVLPGSAALLPPDGKRAAWIGASPDRPGVLVADLP
ncbi:MAG TPA: hypothetical protein VFM45_00545 [Anaeromyxobacteraceae bacterium]|nr:hypothetical protein [Anaeromyxobacteraceae bacterium]